MNLCDKLWPTGVVRLCCNSAGLFVALGAGFLNFQSFVVLLLIVDEELFSVGLCEVTENSKFMN